MQYAKPYLEKYKGRKSRHECPSCHDKYSFTYYLDGDTGQRIAKHVGRCDHESSCGYHYTPKEYFQDNPNEKPEHNATYKAWAKSITIKPVKTPTSINKIPKEYLSQSLGYNSNFVAFLCRIFDQGTLESSTIERIMRVYYLGQTSDKGVIFWQIGADKRIRTGKIMQYNPQTGKRVKNAAIPVDWVHARLKKAKVLPDDFELEQCLFGEHLLACYPDKTVALVESEKSAIIGYGRYPNYVWLATGGKSQLSADKLKVLKGHTVILFPDSDGYKLWMEKAKELEQLACMVIVSDVLENNASTEDKVAKIDIADWLIRDLKQPERKPAVRSITSDEEILQQLGSKNPAIYELINALDLVSVKTN